MSKAANVGDGCMERHCFLSGICPDQHCQTKLYFPSYDASVECTNCGQRHPRDALKGVTEVTDPDVALHNMVRNLLMGNLAPKKTTDSVKVLGLSNYHCKLLSPLLTNYGMDKQGKAQPLRSLNQNEIFDCGNLGGRAFLIQPEHIDIMGYGRDQTGSARYLDNTLEQIKLVNGNQEVLIPIHADGDGHCLVHGISRALVGRELFWHALRTNLKMHFEQNLGQYQTLFRDFVDKDEWPHIIAESDPDYFPGPNEAMGLQNIHIFGLANVLRRPIILLDSLSGLQSFGDYSGMFLPVLSSPDACRGKDGKLNKPLCVAWSSSGRNHFIALVGVKGRPLPRLPRWMLTKAWGTPQEAIDQYIEFDQDGMCTVGGDRTLPEKYVQRLATAMESLFLDKHGVHPSLVSDVYNYIYKRTGISGIHQDVITRRTHDAVVDHQLYRCLICSALSQVSRPPSGSAPDVLAGLKSGGDLYRIAKTSHGGLQEGRLYSFPAEDVQCTYDSSTDELVLDLTYNQAVTCPWCQGKQLRGVKADGAIMYINGDRTRSPSASTACNCGYKHFWDGREYDNMPLLFEVPLVWKGQTIEEEVVWFQNEIQPELNSNAFRIAERLVNKHFPGEFGNEQLVQKVVESILQNTARKEPAFQPPSLSDMPSTSSTSPSAAGGSPHHGGASPRHRAGSAAPSEGAESPRRQPGAKSKEGSPQRVAGTSMTSSKSLHKEELALSETERKASKQISERTPHQQGRQTSAEERRKQTPRPAAPPEGSGISAPEIGSAEHVATEAETESRTIEPPRNIKIKLSSSDGRQATLIMDPATSYSQLQGLIEARLHVAPAQQRLKFGFPPKELRAPSGGEEEVAALPLRSGDKLIVQILPDPNSVTDAPHQSGRMTAGIAGNRPKRAGSSERALDQEALLREFQKGFQRMANSEENNLEVQLTSLSVMAACSRMNLWTYSKSKPELFERGGLFYNIVERDLGLEDGKHCMLPAIPEKRFRFSKTNDRLELCLEPLGHFPVTEQLDDLEKFNEVTLGQRSLEKPEPDHPTDSDVGKSATRGYVAFAGLGLSLGGEGAVGAADQTEGEVPGVPTAPKTLIPAVEDGRNIPGLGTTDAETGAIVDSVMDLEEQVQCGEPRIPDKSEHPWAGMDVAGTAGHSAAAENPVYDVCKVELDERMDEVEAIAGTKPGDLDHTIVQDGEGGCQMDIPMDTDTQDKGVTLEHVTTLPMELDSSAHQKTAADGCGSGAEGLGEAVHQAIVKEATGAGTGITRDGQVNVVVPSESDQGIDSNKSQDAEPANEDPGYISRRLGPGYTVLVKKEDGKS